MSCRKPIGRAPRAVKAAPQHCVAAFLIILILASPLVQAAESTPKSPFTVDLAVGLEWDSNVSIEAIESGSDVSDTLAKLAAKLKYKARMGGNNVSLNYSANRSLHDDFSDFDLLTQIASGEFSREFGSLTAGLNARYIDAELDSLGLLSFAQGGVFMSSLVNRELFFRSEYSYTDKTFDDLPERDATSHSLDTTAYWFQRGGKQYWMVGLRLEDEDAFADQFDRTATSLRTQFQRKLKMWGKNARARASARYQLRDYDAITPSIGVLRDDKRFRGGLQLEVELAGHTYVQFDLKYSDNQSNLPSADYSQTQLGVTVGWRNQ